MSWTPPADLTQVVGKWKIPTVSLSCVEDVNGGIKMHKGSRHSMTQQDGLDSTYAYN